MPDHDLKSLEAGLRGIAGLSDELLKIIYLKGYTTPREFALVNAAVQAMAAQMKTLVNVSKEIVGQAHAQSA
jgi:hypothetical protein